MYNVQCDHAQCILYILYYIIHGGIKHAQHIFMLILFTYSDFF